MTFLVWWLSEKDQDIIGDPRLAWPEWLQREYTDRRGRAGRGRLWVAAQFERACEPFIIREHPGWMTPIGLAVDRCGGIVITEAEIPLLADLPGLLTDLSLRRYSPLQHPPSSQTAPCPQAAPISASRYEQWPLTQASTVQGLPSSQDTAVVQPAAKAGGDEQDGSP